MGIPDPERAKFAANSNAFALELFSELRKSQAGNLFFSPFSISSALAMTCLGARGETAAQMRAALHFPEQDERLHGQFLKLTNELEALIGYFGGALDVANRMFTVRSLLLKAEFKDATRRRYGAEAEALDIKSDPEKARQHINSWVARTTQEKIRELIPPGILDHALLVLVNAVYFKSDWLITFPEHETAPGQFYCLDKTVTVPMMHKSDYFTSCLTDGVQCLQLAYKGDALSMLVLLPEKQDQYRRMELALTLPNLEKWASRLHADRIDVYLPRFKLTGNTLDLKEHLKRLGMTRAFEPEADFSGIAENEPLRIDSVFHQAFVEVNERGTEAAASTAVMAARGGLSNSFLANRPFVFLIRENKTGTILFMGRVMNPQS